MIADRPPPRRSHHRRRTSGGEGTWDRRPGWFVKPGGLATGVTDRDTANAEHIKLTLQRLKETVEARLGPACDFVGEDGDR